MYLPVLVSNIFGCCILECDIFYLRYLFPRQIGCFENELFKKIYVLKMNYKIPDSLLICPSFVQNFFSSSLNFFQNFLKICQRNVGKTWNNFEEIPNSTDNDPTPPTSCNAKATKFLIAARITAPQSQIYCIFQRRENLSQRELHKRFRFGTSDGTWA